MTYIASDIHWAIRDTLQGYAWPGGYPLVLLMSDGGVLCPKCVRENIRLIVGATHDEANGSGPRFGWGAVDAITNWDDCDMNCAHCGAHIEPAYEE